MQDARTSPGATQTDKAYASLRAAIVRCELEPGDRLRVEELGRLLDVSSSPLREALSRLAAQGLVDAFEHRGFRVAPLSVAGIGDLTRVRLLVEREALRDAMANGDDAWEAGIVAAAHALSIMERRQAAGPLTLDEEWSTRHRDFHLALYAGSRSLLLRELAGQLFDRAARYRAYSARVRKTPRYKHAEHDRLMRAVLAREEQRALDLLTEHLSATERGVTAALLSMDVKLAQPAPPGSIQPVGRHRS